MNTGRPQKEALPKEVCARLLRTFRPEFCLPGRPLVNVLSTSLGLADPDRICGPNPKLHRSYLHHLWHLIGRAQCQHIAWEEVLPERLNFRATKVSIMFRKSQRRGLSCSSLWCYPTFTMKHNEKNFMEKQWCADPLCPVTQALHIFSQCPGLCFLIKSSGQECNKLYSVKEHPIT